MTSSLAGLAVGMLAFTLGLVLWQMVINIAAMGVTQRPPLDPETVRIQLRGLVIRVAICWLAVFGGLAGFALYTVRGLNIWVWACLAVMAVPLLVLARGWRRLNTPIATTQANRP